MPSIKKAVASKAVSSTAKHTAHGTAAKLKRKPLRTTTLLGLGAAAGGFVGWMLGRATTGTASLAAPGAPA
jgi:membrane protein YqaA with SNARE-associated domain